jgi:hypothetical protein
VGEVAVEEAGAAAAVPTIRPKASGPR